MFRMRKLDRGINLIDTAPVYGLGRSEEIVGKAPAKGGRRKRVYIATHRDRHGNELVPVRSERRITDLDVFGRRLKR